ncbi:carbon-nitrogen hydrolase family protein [Aliidiomarina halalkaliphila]|uniref:Carbon-nitrogen hydrolase family protein n=1 Tax=Aliidiomarina halalkaliphila TaxID=2593535 RepID=A0A552X5Z5_9GAMM|nr:carbon-nitrogen hydrolase family protein [Aliidiomarina halalkaliphila]TRW50451.1 carbon-nitrogen hydrolase family protein [Aliidiomarina halalkaliphila]
MAAISLLQWTSRAEWAENKRILHELLASTTRSRDPEEPHLVVLPEMFARFGAGEKAQGQFAEPAGSGEVQDWLAAAAEKFNVWILAGTLPLQAGERYAAASILFDADGQHVARYDKIHLFDADVEDGTKSYRESKFTRPGQSLQVVDTPFGKLGLAVCYDLRFPEQFRALRSMGAELIALPSAFTEVTGRAHWLPLLQARAIENQVYMLAPNQCGQHDDGRHTWGHSMVVDPWGRVLGVIENTVGTLTVRIDHNELQAVRKRMPVQQHNQFEVRFIHD